MAARTGFPFDHVESHRPSIVHPNFFCQLTFLANTMRPKTVVPHLLSSLLPECRAIPGAFSSMAFQIVQSGASDPNLDVDGVPSDFDQEMVSSPGLQPTRSAPTVLPAITDEQFWRPPQISADLSSSQTPSSTHNGSNTNAGFVGYTRGCGR